MNKKQISTHPSNSLAASGSLNLHNPHPQPHIDQSSQFHDHSGEVSLATVDATAGHPNGYNAVRNSSGNFTSPLRAPYWHELKEVQAKVQSVFPMFPTQNHQDFLDCNYEVIVKKAATQMQFLFAKSRMNGSVNSFNALDTEYNQLMKRGEDDELDQLKNSLQKSDDLIKNLRRENEYFQKQLDSLRREAEQIRQHSTSGPRTSVHNPQMMTSHFNNNHINRSSSYERANMRASMNSGFEPLPIPQPHPQPVLIQQQQMIASQRGENSRSTTPVKKPTRFPASGKSEKSNKRQPRTGKKLQTLQTEGDDQDEVRELKFDVQQKEEMLALKAETIKNLQAQLDQQKRRFTSDTQKLSSDLTTQNEALRRKVEDAEHSQVSKDKMLSELKKQVDEMLASRCIEMSLIVNKPSFSNEAGANKENKTKDKKRQNIHAVGGGTGQQNKNLKFAMDINKEMELMFGDDYSGQPHEPVNKKKKLAQKKKVQLPLESYSQITTDMLLPESMLMNQIQAAQLSETLIDELRQAEAVNKGQVNDLTNQCESLKVHQGTLIDQKTSLVDQLGDLSKSNDTLKVKFSSLLDQFQEYVTVQESKKEENQEKQKLLQEELLQNMQSNIRELEQVTEGLQSELKHKEGVFELLKKENESLEQCLAAKSNESDSAVNSAVQSLEDEIRFLKRHYEIEINMLREQYERSLTNANLAATEQQKHAQAQVQQAQEQQKFINEAAIAAQSQMNGMSEANSSIRLSQFIGQPSSITHETGAAQYQGSQPNQSQYDHQQQPLQQITAIPVPQMQPQHQVTPNQSRVKDIITSTQHTFEKMKNDLTQKEQLIEEKNRELLKLKVQNEEIVSRYKLHAARHTGGNAPSQESKQFGSLEGHERRQIVKDLSYLVETLRGEIQRIKQSLFAKKGLTMQLENRQNMIPVATIATEESLQNELNIQMQEIRAVLSVVTEVGMLVANSNPIDQPSQGIQKTDDANSNDNNYQTKRNADTMLRTGHAAGLHELLLSQITRSEALMQDNALLQRSMYKYETTLAELDSIFRNDKSGEIQYDLKKVIEGQLKQILALQRETDTLRSMVPPGVPLPNPTNQTHIPPSVTGTSYDVQVTQKKEIDGLRHQLNEQRDGQQELINERQNLMQLVESLEDQVKDSHNNLEEALDRITSFEKQVDEKVQEMEEIRNRITKVAELFERKEIKQKYSFEVLCDFVHDKAKRLFNKYDNVSKEKKVMQEEKNYYYQRKVDQLEQENQHMKEATRTADKVMSELVPRLSDLLERPIHRHQEQSEFYYARQVLEMVEIEFRTLKKGHAVLKDRTNELMRQTESFKQELVRRPAADQSQAPNQSLLDYRLMQARQQEHEEVLGHAGRPVASTGRDRSPMNHLNGRGSQSPLRGPTGAARGQSSRTAQNVLGGCSSNPLRSAYAAAQDRQKSVEKDNKDSSRGIVGNVSSRGRYPAGGDSLRGLEDQN